MSKSNLSFQASPTVKVNLFCVLGEVGRGGDGEGLWSSALLCRRGRCHVAVCSTASFRGLYWAYREMIFCVVEFLQFSVVQACRLSSLSPLLTLPNLPSSLLQSCTLTVHAFFHIRCCENVRTFVTSLVPS